MITKNIVNYTVQRLIGDIEFSAKEVKIPRLDKVAFNVRIPFCRAQCPFCLFNNYPWRRKMAKAYLKAVKKEIDLYAGLLGETEVNAIYFSGGTPTVMPEGIAEIVEYIRDSFKVTGKVSSEANPTDLDDKTLVDLLDAGVENLSIGIQSFNDGVLKAIGRGYDGDLAFDAVKRALETGYDYVNIDLMFSLPRQNLRNLRRDLEIATAKLKVSGISTYPLMLLPYTTLYERAKRGLEKLPGERREETMYDTIVDFLAEVGYAPSAIWRFSRKPSDYCGPFEYEGYIGLGPNAWSITGKNFYINTSSLDNYIRSSVKEKLPVAGAIEFTKDKQMTLWFLRKLYHTKVSKSQFFERFNARIDDELKRLLFMLRFFGLVVSDREYVHLTRKGMHYASSATKTLAESLLSKFLERAQVSASLS